MRATLGRLCRLLMRAPAVSVPATEGANGHAVNGHAANGHAPADTEAPAAAPPAPLNA